MCAIKEIKHDELGNQHITFLIGKNNTYTLSLPSNVDINKYKEREKYSRFVIIPYNISQKLHKNSFILLYGILGNLIGDTKFCWKCPTAIYEEIGLDRRSGSKALKELIEKKIISEHKVKNKVGKFLNSKILLLECLENSVA